jgi:TM2 domain-containing membrane protein YozV
MCITLRSITIVVGLSLVAANASAQQSAAGPMNQPEATWRVVELTGAEWRSPLAQAARDPNKAFSRALFGPGLGHFYCGDSARGAVLLGTAAGGLVAGLLLSGDGKYNPDEHKYNRDRTPLLVGGGVAAGSYVLSLLDARRSCIRNGL